MTDSASAKSRASRKNKYNIQYGYRKWATHPKVFFRTLTHGKSNNEKRQINS